MQGWEAAAALLGIAYLLLAARENAWCWVAGFVSNAIYLFVLHDAGLLMDSALQVYYMGIAVYGWIHWRRGLGGGDGADNPRGEHMELPVRRWPLRRHMLAIGAVAALSIASGLLLTRYTQAAHPFLDAFTTWGAVLTTWMVARKLLENWLYWIIIDTLSIYLYIDRGLELTALLFAVYTVLAVFGYRQWLTHYQKQKQEQKQTQKWTQEQKQELEQNPEQNRSRTPSA